MIKLVRKGGGGRKESEKGKGYKKSQISEENKQSQNNEMRLNQV